MFLPPTNVGGGAPEQHEKVFESDVAPLPQSLGSLGRLVCRFGRLGGFVAGQGLHMLRGTWPRRIIVRTSFSTK